MTFRSAGHLIVETLAHHDVERVYSVPGESFLDLLDGLHDSDINNIVCRQEGGVGFMAMAEGRLTGRPGIAMVTRGPGAANFLIAAHCAYQDATPLVCFIGLVPIDDRRRESFQEFSIDSWFGSTAKRVLTIETADQAGEIVSEAMHVAASGRPGPVIVGLPEDILRGETDAPVPQPRPVAAPSPSFADMMDLQTRLERAERPLMVVGGDGFSGDMGGHLADWALASNIPVVADWRNYDAVPNEHVAYGGWLGYGRRDSIVEALRETDLFIGVGAVRSDVMSEGHTAGIEAETVLVSTDAELLQHSGRVDQLITATPANFVAQLRRLEPVPGPRTESHVRELRASHERFTGETDPDQHPHSAYLDRVFLELERKLGKDRILAYGAGNATIWGHRFLTHSEPKSLIASRNGAMGLSVPAAVAAAIARSDHQVVAVCGDGDFFMNGQEVATLAAQNASALFIVIDNSCYATIVGHQQRWYPDRPSGTSLKNPDFAAWVESFGGVGARLEPGDDPVPALERLLETDGPTLLHIVVDPSMPPPDSSKY